MEHAAQEYKIVIGKIGFHLMKSSGKSVRCAGIRDWTLGRVSWSVRLLIIAEYRLLLITWKKSNYNNWLQFFNFDYLCLIATSDKQYRWGIQM